MAAERIAHWARSDLLGVPVSVVELCADDPDLTSIFEARIDGAVVARRTTEAAAHRALNAAILRCNPGRANVEPPEDDLPPHLGALTAEARAANAAQAAALAIPDEAPPPPRFVPPPAPAHLSCEAESWLARLWAAAARVPGDGDRVTIPADPREAAAWGGALYAGEAELWRAILGEFRAAPLEALEACFALSALGDDDPIHRVQGVALCLALDAVAVRTGETRRAASDRMRADWRGRAAA